MQILEEYQELVARNAVEISYLWKFVQMLLYLSCAISGYVCSVLFYIIWEHVFEGNCPLWAKSVSMLTTELEHNGPDKYFPINSSCANWWKHVVTDYEYEHICNIYLITCFLSCLFGIIWFALFLMCGKGGYGEHDAIIDEAPWRIVPPAILFNFIFLLVTTYTASALEEGYKEFTKDLRNVFLEICTEYKASNNTSKCEIVQSYVNAYNFHDHDVCNILLWLQVFSAVMSWNWIACFIVLILRVIVIVDFRILKVTIYELPENHAIGDINMDKTEESNDKHKEKNS